MGIFLYIDIDAFFASVEQSINPSLVGRPVMVGGHKGERGVVACPSYEARARGVRTGTTLHEAARLIPDGIFLRGDYNRYQHFSNRFYEILCRYTPELDRISQDEACLNIGGALRPYGTARELAQNLQMEVRQTLALSTSIGIGPSRVAAKIASEYKKPLGLTIIDSGNVNSFFKDLAVRNIPGVGRGTEKTLHEMGIDTAGQLAAVPEEYLETIFGINGLKMAAYSRGEDGPRLRDYKVIRSVSRETGFADDITDRRMLLSHYYYLLERGTAKLRCLHKKAATIKVKFRYADFETIEGIGRIAPPSNDETTIFPTVERMFDGMFTRRRGIRLAGIALANLKNYAENESFLNDTTEKSSRLLKSLDAARGRSGFFSLMTGRTLSLSERYKKGDTGYVLRTPGLSQ
ncbi:putative DNA polymerase IV [Candidatus Zixiibacteriota bacterium]|nr:putative DNA polymerase IV [candidate division Zixibacteria bacterium]